MQTRVDIRGKIHYLDLTRVYKVGHLVAGDEVFTRHPVTGIFCIAYVSVDPKGNRFLSVSPGDLNTFRWNINKADVYNQVYKINK